LEVLLAIGALVPQRALPQQQNMHCRVPDDFQHISLSQTVNNIISSASRTIRGMIAGFCSSVVGIGLSRFAYTPLIPALVTEHWFSGSQAAYIGAANLIGYLLGALNSLNLTRAISVTTLLPAMMLVVTASFFASAHPLPFAWFFAWRFAAGFAGGVLMVMGMATALEQIPENRRGFSAGIAIGGVGVGIIASGTLVPILLTWGLSQTWLGLGTLSLILTALAWPLWPSQHRAARPRPKHGFDRNQALWLVYAPSALTAMGLVPYFIFVVDFIARGLNHGIVAGAHVWVASGISALFGAALIGHVGDSVGFKNTFRCGFVIQALAVGSFAFADSLGVLLIASVMIGAFIPAIVPLVLGRIKELIPGDATAQRAVWRTATASFGVGQAVAGYVYSFIFSTSSGDYRLLFLLGALCFVIALCLDFYLVRSPQQAKASIQP